MVIKRSQTGQLARASAMAMLLLFLAGCQTTAAGGKAQAADLSPPALASNYEQEGDDGTRSFLASQTQRAVVAPQVDFYVGLPQPVAGLVQVDGPQGPLWLYPQVIVQRSDLTRVATLRTEQGGHLVRFQLNSLGARKLAEVSSGNVGALLVLVMEDQVAQVARIGEPLQQGMIYLSMPDDAAAQRLLRRVQG
ncbi:MAG: SecDF P1 head subdomain-containing protein [Alcaligenes sp.]